MNKTISILLFEDSGDDEKLVYEQLDRAEFQHSCKCVTTADAFKKSLKNNNWDLILSSYKLSEAKIHSILEFAFEHDPDIPFIVLADRLPQEDEVSAFNAGARDILFKDSLHRLLPVIKRELQAANTRKKYNSQKSLAEEFALNSKLKSRFMAAISHEMRTTLNSIVLLSKLLAENREENLNAGQLEYADVIYESGNSLLELLNKVLDLSKIKSGKMGMQLEEVDIGVFSKSLERMFLPQAREKGLSLIFKNAEADIYKIRTDHIRVGQILKNLLSNAIKFTDEGSVTLETYSPGKKELSDINFQAANALAFRVRDTGVGIPENKQHLVFESFRQVNEEQERYGGTGLGLTICKELTEILGGKLILKSNEGGGCIFTLYLPEDSSKSVYKNVEEGKVELYEINSDSNYDASAPVEKVPNGQNGKDHKVLIVDDSKIHRLALKEFIGAQIENCITAGTAEDTYHVLESNNIGCLILDMHLPDADGYEVLTKIKSQQQYADLPVIIYTGQQLSQEEEDELKRYADSIVYKKVESYKILMNEITTHLTKAQQN